MTTHYFVIETTDYANCASKKAELKFENQDNHKRIFNKALRLLHLEQDCISRVDKFIKEKQDGVPLLIYPYSLDDSKDLKHRKGNAILSVEYDSGDKKFSLQTFGLMGYISITLSEDKDENEDSAKSVDEYHFDIFIHSRFDWNGEPKIRYCGNQDNQINKNASSICKDFFLHYMLQHALNLNIFDCNPSAKESDSELELMLYFFPGMLRRAMNQGLYKRYVHREYNDDKVRGPIDVARHIRSNMPFRGNIAYSATEFDYDNPVTQLVRHTIEYMRHHEWASQLLSQSEQTAQDVQIIVQNTERYEPGNLHSVLSQNIHPLSHPYFTEWMPLQYLCLSILLHNDMDYSSERDEDNIHGILFDGPWLWENYLDALYTSYNLGFKHPDNNERKDAIRLYQKDDKGERYPDFYKPSDIASQSEPCQYAEEIWDAKYKLHYGEGENIEHDDINQVISYMYIQSKLNSDNTNSVCRRGGFVFPIDIKSKQDTCFVKIGTLEGIGGELYKWGLKIPSPCEYRLYGEFCNKMKENEEEFRNSYRVQDS